MTFNLSPKHWLIGTLCIVFACYVVFQARFLILGPQISIESHVDGAVVSAPVIALAGEAINVAKLTLNDRQIFTDEEGHWEEKLIVSKGMSIMTLRARDRFGRETEEDVRIIFN